MSQATGLATIERERGDRVTKQERAGRPRAVRQVSPADLSRRRFTTAVVVGTAIVIPFALWLCWDLWTGSVDIFRGVPYDNFYDLQARAMFHGHLSIPKASLGIEAFIHDGRAYTYFGLFPSLLRMPILILTSSLDGRLTAPFLLMAWASTAVLSSLMLWRLRILMRGDALLGRMEATAFGIFMTTIMGGSVVLFLVATPFIYSEDFAWSVPLTIGSLFYLLGMLERPNWRTAGAALGFVLCTNLNRTPAGYACTITALLIAAWFFFGRMGRENRRWTLPLVAVGVIPFLVNCAVTYAKFGLPIGLPMADQVWASVNAHRRYFLTANHGKAFSFSFLPSTLWAYLQPFGIRLSNVFPFVAPPGAPAPWLGGAVLDQTYPTASLPATSPLLFLLAVWGSITAFRPRALGRVHLARFVLLGAAAGSAGVLLWGYISERYLADLMPFFIIAAGIGFIDLWRRVAKHRAGIQRAWLGVLGVATVYAVAATLAISVYPIPSWWSTTQPVNYTRAVASWSAGSIAGDVMVGKTLPEWAPAGTLFATPDCSGLYLSSGASFKDVPGQYIEHYGWMPVVQSKSFDHFLSITFNKPVRDLNSPVPLLHFGAATLVIRRLQGHFAQFYLENSGTSIKWPPASGWYFAVLPHMLHKHIRFEVVTDPIRHSLTLYWYGRHVMLNHYVAGNGPGVLALTPKGLTGSSRPAVSVTANRNFRVTPNVRLCRDLLLVHRSA